MFRSGVDPAHAGLICLGSQCGVGRNFFVQTFFLLQTLFRTNTPFLQKDTVFDLQAAFFDSFNVLLSFLAEE